jgi:hypothetical protein
MARIHTSGFESGIPATPKTYDGESNNLVAGGVNHVMVGTVTYQGTTARNGGMAMRCGPSGGNYTQIDGITHADGVPMYNRFYARFDDATPSQVLEIWQWRINAVVVCSLRLLSSGAIQLRDSVGQIGSNTAALSANTWYMFETKLIVNSSGVGTLELKIDGVVVATSASASTGTAFSPTTHRLGHLNAGESQTTVFVDDLAINDGSGSDNTGYPGPGNVTLLKPAGDFVVQTGWVAGAGGATLYPAVDNVPPVGVVLGSATDTSQAKNITNLGAASSYYPILQRPIDAGVPPGARINLSQAIARVSSDSTTGTNTMEVRSIVPGDAAATTVDAEVGAVAGTDPTGWKTVRTPYINAPSLATDAYPILQVTKTQTGVTRAHMVDQMGLLVEWIEPIRRSASLDVALDAAVSRKLIRRRSVAVSVTLATLTSRLLRRHRSAGMSVGLGVAVNQHAIRSRLAGMAVAFEIATARERILSRSADLDVGLGIASSAAPVVVAALIERSASRGLALEISTTSKRDLLRAAGLAVALGFQVDGGMVPEEAFAELLAASDGTVISASSLTSIVSTADPRTTVSAASPDSDLEDI